MRIPSSLLALGISLSFTVASVAYADVPPPNSCPNSASVGQACNDAPGPNGYTANGVCTSTTCSKTMPSPDGGTTTFTNPCILCLQASADAGPVSSSDGGTATDGGVTTEHSSSCAVANGGMPRGSLPALLGVALALAGLRRRRAV